jgi:uncharacterized protein (DUF433 family)
MMNEAPDWQVRDQPSEIVQQMSEPLATHVMFKQESYRPDFFLRKSQDRVGRPTGFLDSLLCPPEVPGDAIVRVQLVYAAQELPTVVAIDPALAGGVPVIAGTNVTVARVLAVIAAGYNVSEVSSKLDIDTTKISQLLHSFANHLDRPFLQPAKAPHRPDWVTRLEELGTNRPTTSSLSMLVDTVFDLVSDQRFDTLNLALCELDAKRVSTDALVSLLRLTFSAKDSIPSWTRFLERARVELEGRGIDSKLELMGLTSAPSTIKPI